MGMNAIVEKDRLQRERDELRIVLERATRIDALKWRAEKVSNLWDFGEATTEWKNRRPRRAYTNVVRGLTLGALIAKIQEVEK